jgi:hypothetical protein
MASECYDCVEEGSGGHSGLFTSISQLALTDGRLMAKLEKVEGLGDAIRQARLQAWPSHRREANAHVCSMLESALGGPPYASEPDRAQYLHEWLDRVRSEAQGAENKAAKSAVERFLKRMHSERTKADYDPLAVGAKPLGGTSHQGPAAGDERPADFPAEAADLVRIARSFAEHVSAYIDDVLLDRAEGRKR